MLILVYPYCPYNTICFRSLTYYLKSLAHFEIGIPRATFLTSSPPRTKVRLLRRACVCGVNVSKIILEGKIFFFLYRVNQNYSNQKREPQFYILINLFFNWFEFNKVFYALTPWFDTQK